jgi:hypothetical protein
MRPWRGAASLDLATGKGQRRGTIKEAPERISQRDLGVGGSRLVACLCYADDTMMQTRRRLLTTLSLARAVDHGNAGFTLVDAKPRRHRIDCRPSES